MLEEVKIENTNELEFAVFCIENIAIKLKKNRVGLAKAHLFFNLFHWKLSFSTVLLIVVCYNFSYIFAVE